MKSRPELMNILNKVMENQEKPEEIDPLQFPWIQSDRHVYGFIFVVNLSDPSTFNLVQPFS